MGARNVFSGKQAYRRLLNEMRDIEELNLCGWSDAKLYMVATAITAILHVFIRIPRSYEDMANDLGVSPRTIRRRIREGTLPKPRNMGHLAKSFDPQEVDEYLEKNKDK